MNVKLWNLDNEEDVIFVITYNGHTRSIPKAELVAILESNSKRSEFSAPVTGRTLASIGKITGIIRRDRFDALTADDCQRMVATIRSFDGNLSRKRSSQVGRWLRDIMGWKTATADLKREIEKFLNRYPELEAIPIRKASSVPRGS